MPTQVRVKEVVTTMRVVDGDSVLSPALVERLVSAVLDAMQRGRRDEAARRRDTRIGGGCGEGGDTEQSA